MNFLAYFRYLLRRVRLTPTRYFTLLEELYCSRGSRILEVGTYDGRNAVRMIQTAKIFNSPSEIEYVGFDLFEDMTESILEKEFSKNPPSRDEVEDRLEQTDVEFSLAQGFTEETLPEYFDNDPPAPDFVFVDGGHHIDTIRSDWRVLRRNIADETIIIFDDYYENEGDEVSNIGVQHLYPDIDKTRYDVTLLDPLNTFEKDWGTLKIRLMKVVPSTGE